jgi:hypothetical protein
MKLQETARQQQDYLRLLETQGLRQCTEHKKQKHVQMKVLVSTRAGGVCVLPWKCLEHIRQTSATSTSEV